MADKDNYVLWLGHEAYHNIRIPGCMFCEVKYGPQQRTTQQ